VFWLNHFKKKRKTFLLLLILAHRSLDRKFKIREKCVPKIKKSGERSAAGKTERKIQWHYKKS
jgi:hypothetical protein